MSPNPAIARTLGDARATNRNLLPWFAIECLNSYAATLFCTGAYDFADAQLHVTPALRLWLSATWGFAYIFISLQSGRLAERFGPRRVVGAMVLLSAFTALIPLLTMKIPSVFLLLLLMIPFNFTSSTIWPAIESAITRTHAPMPLNMRTAMYNVSWGSAGFVSFFTCGALEKLWWGNVFFVPALCSALSFILFLLFAAPESAVGKEHVPEESEHERELDTPDMQHRAKTLLHLAWIGNALAYVAINVVLPVKMRLATEAGIENLTTIGFATSVWGLVRVFAFAALWKWSGWHYKFRWLLGGQIALWISFVLLLVFNNIPMLILMQIVFGLATAMIYSSSFYYAMHVSEGHGGHAGIHEALIGLGICVGPAVSALASGDAVRHEAFLRIATAVSIVMALGILAMLILSRRLKSAKISPA
ncbi:MAG: MFS transporter [Phycisphaerae bacterium]